MRATVRITRCRACQRIPHWLWRCHPCDAGLRVAVSAALTQPEALAAVLAHLATHHPKENQT